jgi:DNA-binding NarL/FixJ family response regulator
MSTYETSGVPVVIVGGDPAAREWCHERIAGRGVAQVIVEGDEISAPLAEQIGELRQGAVVAVGPLRGHAGNMTAQIRAIRQAAPSLPVIVVSQPPPVVHAHIAGWLSFGSPVDLCAAVLVAASGGWVSDRVVALAHAREPKPQLAIVATREHAMPTPLSALTARETQVLALLSQGLTNPDIARALQITPETVKSHVRHIMQKLRVRDRTQAAVVATRARIA